MGKGAFMLIVNNDSNSHTTDIQNIHDMYDGGQEGSNLSIWSNRTLSHLDAIPSEGMEYVEAKDDSAHFDVVFDNGITTVRISVDDDGYSYSTSNSHLDLSICVNNEGNENGQAFITITINRPNGYSAWMHHFNDEVNGAFLRKTLSQVCLPGAHDAGMSVLTKSTSMSTECNTKTQIHSIGGQLNRGTRYFDLRPAIWSSSDTTIYMGHFSGWPIIGEEGSIGQSLNDVLNDVINFIDNDSHGEEVVVLKFSHFVSQDGSGFTNSLLSSFITQLKSKLGNYMYTNSNYNVNLGGVTLQSIIDSGKRVICLLTAVDTPDDGNTFTPSQLNAQINPSQGIFSFGDNDSNANYRLFDEYANDHDYDDMVSNQIKKWDDFRRSNNSMFLFSYTLTSTSGGITGDCVLDMAEAANPVFTANLAYFKKKKSINEIPNILYIDRVSTHHAAIEALYINKLFL
jgi:hypothetical protein